jgi:Putative member of DMT superfamily (DUF486)
MARIGPRIARPRPFAGRGLPPGGKRASCALWPRASSGFMRTIPIPVLTIGLLILSNVFMTFAWYGHLKFKSLPLVLAILIS